MKVWRINWASVMAFLACSTQWNVIAGAAGPIWTGIDYAGADVVLRRRACPNEVFEDLQVMESAALEAMGEMQE